MESTMEIKEIKEIDDGHGNITWCKGLGSRCLACCEFFENIDDVTYYKNSGHYICQSCDMPIGSNGDYVGQYYVSDEVICFRCIMSKNLGFLKMDDENDSIACVESEEDSDSDS